MSGERIGFRARAFAAVVFVALLVSSPDLSAGSLSTVRVLALRDGNPVAGVEAVLRREGGIEPTRAETDEGGVALFSMLEPGPYLLTVGAVEQRLELTSEVELVPVDLAMPSIPIERFGRWTASRAFSSRLPQVGTVSNFLETIEPFAVTHRIDVAGIESATEPRWSVRGSSFTQNRILLDGLDITDPAGGTSLLYPDAFFFEEISLATAANGAAAGPGTELRLVTPRAPCDFAGSASFRATGSTLQSENIGSELAALGVEPRAMLRYPSGRFEAGANGLYGAVEGFSLTTRIPRFDAVERASLLGLTGKLSRGPWSALGVVQWFRRPTFGARPDVAPEATVDATEGFQIAQASYRSSRWFATVGFARGRLAPRVPEQSFGVGPLRDLATGRIEDAPPRIVSRERTRLSATAFREWTRASHIVRAGVELAHAHERASIQVPTGVERLTIDGLAHAISVTSGSGNANIDLDRISLFCEDDLVFELGGQRFRLAPGGRLNWSHSAPMQWLSASGALRGQMKLAPSVELHSSAGLYHQELTSRLGEAVGGNLSWTWYRWSDVDSDLRVSPGEIGAPMRRGGPDLTTVDAKLPRPRTYELTLGIEKRFRNGFVRVSGYQRWERDLLQTVNVGIARDSYEPFLVHDVGPDGVLGTADDRDFTVYDQKAQFGEDRFLLTQPPGLSSSSQGVDLLLGFDQGRLSWRLSGRAYRDVGSGNVGNEVTQNDTGVLGDLFDDPNTLTNSEGRLFFDRAFTGKLSLTVQAPAGILAGAAVRYWDGQPFARHLFFPDLGQGFTVVQAFPRGRLRYTYNMTVDLRVEREFPVGSFRVAAAIEAFNLLNQTLEVQENVQSGTRFRDPILVQPARTFVLEGRLRF